MATDEAPCTTNAATGEARPKLTPTEAGMITIKSSILHKKAIDGGEDSVTVNTEDFGRLIDAVRHYRERMVDAWVELQREGNQLPVTAHDGTEGPDADSEVNYQERRMKITKVMRYDSGLKMVRLFRAEWYTGRYGQGGYATKFSVALRPAIFSFHREHEAWLCTILGVRLHCQRNYGVAWV